MKPVLNPNIFYYNTALSDASKDLGRELAAILSENCISDKTPVILCIGTDRATGDCLGPLVGEKLNFIDDRFIVIGSLSAPVHALNIRRVIQDIYENIPNPYIIAVDAALGVSNHVGFITLSDSPLAPGKGVNKKLPIIGDVSITGIVNVSGANSHNLLQSTRLSVVMKLSDCIADAIKYSVDYLGDF